ncbi:MAG: hypothetical protein H7X97_11410, partial [Opitutaceae bacterium]|nr:hypothetical protein [Verrucomicrobiales bacterium]
GAIRTWHSSAGLPSDAVNAIIQTRDGFLWVGTGAGLVRFDGVKFREVPLSGLETNTPAAITALCEDLAGHLWIATRADGLFELASGHLTHYSRSTGLLDDNVTSLAVDADGFVWIGTRSGLNVATGSKELKSFKVKDGLPHESVSGLHVARSGTIWITTRGGLCRYQEAAGATHSSPAIHTLSGARRYLDGRIASFELQTDSQGRIPDYLSAYEDHRGSMWAFGDTYLINLTDGKRFNYFRSNEATSVRIWSLCEGRDGRLWIGTSGRGLFCLDENRLQPVLLGELQWPHDVRAICEDREGSLWMGTSGSGLVQWQPQPVQLLRVRQGLPAGVPTALALDENESLYAGFERDGVFFREEGRSDSFTNISKLGVPYYVTAVCTADGTFWAGTVGGGLYGLREGRSFRFTTANGLADNTVLAVCADAERNVWASTAAGTIHCFSATNPTRLELIPGLTGKQVTVMIPATTGGLWLGTDDGSIFRAEHRRFQLVQPGERINYQPVLALHESDEEQLWIGSASGLAYWSRRKAASWNTDNGLPSDYVAGIVTDEARNLWLTTGAGLFRAGHSNLHRALTESQVPLTGKLIADARTPPGYNTSFGGNRAVRTRDGRLWFATTEGVLNVDTRRPQIESAAVPCAVESISFNGNPPLWLLGQTGNSQP